MHWYIVFLFSVFQMSYAYQYTLTVTAIFKDEAPYLKEWIEYHKMMGVEHFRLYNNDSEDDYLTVLDPYIQSEEVSLVEWPSSENDLRNWVYSTQWPACVDAINYYKGRSKWLAVIDIDEFLFPLEAPSMAAFLLDYEMHPGVVLNWQCFGTSFVNEIPRGKLLIETFTLKAEEFSERNIALKSIVRPDYVDVHTVVWPPHIFAYLIDTPAVYADKKPREEERCKWRICTEKAVINHYVHRTEQYFWETKIAKKMRMEKEFRLTLEYVRNWHDDCNTVEDKRIFRFVAPLKQRMRTKG